MDHLVVIVSTILKKPYLPTVQMKVFTTVVDSILKGTTQQHSKMVV